MVHRNSTGVVGFKVFSSERVFELASASDALKIKAYLRKHALGREATPSGKILSRYPGGQEALFNKWFSILENSPAVTPELLAYERGKHSKVGPQGGFPPMADRLGDLNGYFTSSTSFKLNPWDYGDLVSLTRQELFGSTAGLTPMSPENVVERLRANGNLSTNSGFPEFRKRNLCVKRSIQDAVSGKWKSYPCIIGSRGQRNKERFIFMAPFSTNIVEQSFLFPLMDAIRANGARGLQAWYGNDAVVDSITSHGFLSSVSFLSTDFTAMDKYTGVEQIEFVIDVLRPLFAEQYQDALEESLRHLNTCSLLIGENELIAGGSHGLFSGLGWTNFSECVLNTGIQIYTQLHLGLARVRELLGDDGTLSWDEDLVNKVAPVFEMSASAFGYVANPEKQLVSYYNLTYLQRFYDTRILFTSEYGRVVAAGSYPGVLGLNSLVHPERFHTPWSSRMESLRAICICENLYQHPCFDQFIELVLSGDTLKLGILIPGFLDGLGLEEAYDSSKSLTGFMPAYTGAHGRLGIRSWATVKYLLRVRHRYIR
jgi:hypothetical protein